MMKKTTFMLGAAMLIMACSANSKPSESTNEQKEQKEQKEPVKPFTLDDCPQTDSQLRVELSKDDEGNQKAVIYKDGKVLQTIAEEEELFSDWTDQAPETFIHFLDANYDGNTDIFLGAGVSRTYSSLLLWNPKTNLFENYNDREAPNFQNPVFVPEANAIFTGGSDSAYEYIYAKHQWVDGKLKKIETVSWIADPAEYTQMNGKKVKKYNLYDRNEKLIKATNDVKQLPEEWQDIVGLDN